MQLETGSISWTVLMTFPCFWVGLLEGVHPNAVLIKITGLTLIYRFIIPSFFSYIPVEV